MSQCKKVLTFFIVQLQRATYWTWRIETKYQPCYANINPIPVGIDTIDFVLTEISSICFDLLASDSQHSLPWWLNQVRLSLSYCWKLRFKAQYSQAIDFALYFHASVQFFFFSFPPWTVWFHTVVFFTRDPWRPHWLESRSSWETNTLSPERDGNGFGNSGVLWKQPGKRAAAGVIAACRR